MVVVCQLLVLFGYLSNTEECTARLHPPLPRSPLLGPGVGQQRWGPVLGVLLTCTSWHSCSWTRAPAHFSELVLTLSEPMHFKTGRVSFSTCLRTRIPSQTKSKVGWDSPLGCFSLKTTQEEGSPARVTPVPSHHAPHPLTSTIPWVFQKKGVLPIFKRKVFPPHLA